MSLYKFTFLYVHDDRSSRPAAAREPIEFYFRALSIIFCFFFTFYFLQFIIFWNFIRCKKLERCSVEIDDLSN